MTTTHGQEPAPNRIEPGRLDAPPSPPRSPSGVSAALDDDRQLRIEALRAAAARLVYGSPTPSIAIPATLEVARAFEAYLRGDL